MITHAGKKVVVEIDLDAETAADDAGHWLGHAATIFDAISAGISSGHLSANDAFLISLSEVCARAFRSVADDEGARLQGVAMAIRDDRARGAESAGTRFHPVRRCRRGAGEGRPSAGNLPARRCQRRD